MGTLCYIQLHLDFQGTLLYTSSAFEARTAKGMQLRVHGLSVWTVQEVFRRHC